MKTLPTLWLGPSIALAVVLAADPIAAQLKKSVSPAPVTMTAGELVVRDRMQRRLDADLEAMRTYRPGFSFWQHIFTIADGSVAYGSGVDGRLLAVFPAAGDWARTGDYLDPGAAAALAAFEFPSRLTDRRDAVAATLETTLGPVLHNLTRGQFLLPNVRRFGAFIDEWGAIYERFGVPADLGLAQAIVESGLNGAARSSARAVGFCQWLLPNWNRLKRLSPYPIEAYNQTTQAPYCAAYLTILATKYGTFIPALSDHHAGGTNVGRTIINGTRLGGQETRDQYFLGSELARDLRLLSPGTYRDAYGSYGPRSFRYAEMVFGNTFTVSRMRTTTPQQRIFAMRLGRRVTLTEVTRLTGLSATEVRRYNPALIRNVPAGATLYLPTYVKSFGPDVSFWHRAPSAAYASVLAEFLALDLSVAVWDSPEIVPTLTEFRRRFQQTRTEEGTVMATVLGYAISDVETSGRAGILADFQSNPHVLALVDQAIRDRDAQRQLRALTTDDPDPTDEVEDAATARP